MYIARVAGKREVNAPRTPPPLDDDGDHKRAVWGGAYNNSGNDGARRV